MAGEKSWPQAARQLGRQLGRHQTDSTVTEFSKNVSPWNQFARSGHGRRPFTRTAARGTHDQGDHGLLLLRVRLGDHDGHGDEHAIGHALTAIDPQGAVHVEEVQEERGGDAVVAVEERVVLCDEASRFAAFSSRLG